MIKIFLTWFIILGTGAVANAGPDRATQTLLRNKVSVFELGMLGADMHLDRLYRHTDFPEGLFPPTISYDWDNDEIIISSLVIMDKGIESSKIGENRCVNFVMHIRNASGVDVENGGLSAHAGGVSTLAQLFFHNGFSVAEVDDAAKQMDKKFRLRCTSFTKTDKGVDSVEVEAELLGRGYSLKR